MKLPFVRKAPARVLSLPPEPRLAGALSPEPRPDRPRLEPGAADVRRRLLRSGASDTLVAHVLRNLARSGARGTHAIDAAARVLGSTFRVLPSPKRSDEPRVIAFVGPPGCGKTTTLAKLGRRLSAAGRRVAYASMDGAGLAGLERVGSRDADVDRTELPIVAVRGAAELRRFVRRERGADVVLLDTPGFSPRDGTALARLARELGAARGSGPLDCYLVLPAEASQGALELAAGAFAALAPDAAVVTKLDETVEPAGALELAARAGLRLAFLCDGQDVRRHLRRPRPDDLADLFLRGRLA